MALLLVNWPLGVVGNHARDKIDLLSFFTMQPKGILICKMALGFVVPLLEMCLV